MTHTDIQMFIDLPGVNKENIKVEIEGDTLVIKGERRQESEEEDKEKNYYKKETCYGSFIRRFSLPENANTSDIKATYKDGVLKLTIPKQETAKETVTVNIE
jgi:HSP20 family protein